MINKEYIVKRDPLLNKNNELGIGDIKFEMMTLDVIFTTCQIIRCYYEIQIFVFCFVDQDYQSSTPGDDETFCL